jgi:cytoskeletal protein CcmA (bactofilin family)
MFGKKADGPILARIDSLVGAGTQVEGSIRFSGGLRIDGEVKGNIEAAEGASRSTLVISEHARVEGSITVAHLVTNGAVVGPVRVAQSLEMQPKAKITGDVEYARIEMHQGAVIEGRLMLLAGEAVELMRAESN